ncbi:MAG: hypothetical protein ACJ74W_21035 [Pyrinomonadaceae bacterium]
MASEIIDYPANGTVDQLCLTCGGDEDVFRGPLTKLERGQDSTGKKGIRATYEPVPPDKPYNKKKLFAFDVTNATAQQQQQIDEQQMAQGHALVSKFEVFLADKPATVAIYREAIKPH